MCSNFRTEVFKLCNMLKKQDEAAKIGELFRNLTVTVENKETGEIKKNLHKDFSYVARHSRNQFHGYLFTDDHADTIELPLPLQIEHLTMDERCLIERGHSTIQRFVELCLGEIKEKSSIIARMMNPYSKYKEVKCEGVSVLPDLEMENAAAAFRNGETYKALLASNCYLILNTFEEGKMSALMQILERDITKEIQGDESEDFFNLVMNSGKSMDVPGALFKYSILIYALRESLALACQMLFRAFDTRYPDKDLIVLNNDNIINIESSGSNIFSEIYKVLIQGMAFDECGDILLIDCNNRDGSHIHKFGRISAETINIGSECGETVKYTFAVVNNELIHIPNITNLIVQSGLPQVRVE